MSVVWTSCSGVWHTCLVVRQSCSLIFIVWASSSTVWHTYGHRVAPYERRMDIVFNRMENAHNRMRGVWTSYDTRVVPYEGRVDSTNYRDEHDRTRFCKNSTVVFSRVHNRVCVKVALASSPVNKNVHKMVICIAWALARFHWPEIAWWYCLFRLACWSLGVPVYIAGIGGSFIVWRSLIPAARFMCYCYCCCCPE